MFTDNELAGMREALGLLMPDTCDILSVTNTRDSQGGVVETWATASAEVACRMDAVSGREAITGGAVQPYHQYTLTLPYDTTITTANRVLHDGVTYAVVAVDTGKSAAITRRAKVERL